MEVEGGRCVAHSGRFGLIGMLASPQMTWGAGYFSCIRQRMGVAGPHLLTP